MIYVCMIVEFLSVDERMKYLEYINALNDKAFELFIDLANSNE